MNWHQHGPYMLESGDAMFKIMRRSFRDRVFKYTLMRAEERGVYKTIGVFETAKQAQQAAEDYQPELLS